jgi:multisubunit Na+/H+ antiporter MnhB subunit
MPRPANASIGGTLAGFLVFGLGFGFLAIFMYHWVGARWPENASQVYLWIALGAAVALSLLALIMPLFFKSPWFNVAIWTTENFIWALGYGLFLPRILNALAAPA